MDCGRYGSGDITNGNGLVIISAFEVCKKTFSLGDPSMLREEVLSVQCQIPFASSGRWRDLMARHALMATLLPSLAVVDEAVLWLGLVKGPSLFPSCGSGHTPTSAEFRGIRSLRMVIRGVQF